jgi:hypothetical protein
MRVAWVRDRGVVRTGLEGVDGIGHKEAELSRSWLPTRSPGSSRDVINRATIRFRGQRDFRHRDYQPWRRCVQLTPESTFELGHRHAQEMTDADDREPFGATRRLEALRELIGGGAPDAEHLRRLLDGQHVRDSVVSHAILHRRLNC